MEKQIIIDRSKEIFEKNLFVLESDQNAMNFNIANDLIQAIKSSSDPIFFILQNPKNIVDLIKDNINCIYNNLYFIVNKIDVDLFKCIKDKSIVREVPHIKGNYALIGNTSLFIFNNDFYGIKINNYQLMRDLCEHFKFLFWEKATKEFIVTLNDELDKIDDFSAVESSKNLIIFDDKNDYINFRNKITDLYTYNRFNYSQEVNNLYTSAFNFSQDMVSGDIYFSKDVFFNIGVIDGDYYLFNFDLNNTEFGKTCFAIKIDNFNINNKYKLLHDVEYKKAFDNDCLLINGQKPLIIESEVNVGKQLIVDIKEYNFLSIMEDQKLDDLLLKLCSKETKLSALKINCNFEIKLKKLSIKTKANVYNDFEKYKDTILKSFKELNKQKIENNTLYNNLLNYSQQLNDKISLNKFIDELNILITDLNNSINNQNKVNNSEYELKLEEYNKKLKEKSKIKDKTKKEIKLNKPEKPQKIRLLNTEKMYEGFYPINGNLYQNKNVFEYQIPVENLSLAIEEIKKAGNIDEKCVSYVI